MCAFKPNDPPDEPPAGSTMIGVPRAPAAPRFGSFAMPMPAPTVHPEPGRGTPAPAPAPFPPDAGGTMIGLPRFPPAAPPGPGRGTPAPLSPEAGGTMIGLPRFGSLPPPAPPPAGFGVAPQPPESGGTMIGLARFGAAPAPPPASDPVPPVAGGTMIGLPRALPGAASFGAPAAFAPPLPRPSGPPPAYEILRHLGGGELGPVFHARHREAGAEVALRVVRPDLARTDGVVQALRDVAQFALAAPHTHLGRLLALDETASPTLVLEYVPGRTLQTLMRERGAAPAAAVIDLGVRLCSALAAAHAAGLAHGRVHAGNVVLEQKTGRWVLLDLAQSYVLGPLEPAHDLYALGALLYELATGRSPFEVEGAPVRDPRAFKPNLPASLAALLLRALAPDPALWFASAPELAQALAKARTQG